MLDLKGSNPRLAARRARGIAARPRPPPSDRLRARLGAARAVRGASGRPHGPLGGQLRASCGHCSCVGRGRRLQGVSVHERLLNPATVAEIRGVADLVMTWPANAAGRARELVAMGVDGLITDRLDLARELGRRRVRSEVSA